MDIAREKDAINAYLKLLQNKGLPSGMLYKRALFLDKLTLHIAEKTPNRDVFSRALDTVINTSTTEDWHEDLNTAREFYPFWVKNMKAIAAFSVNYSIETASVQWKPVATTLKSLTESILTTQFETAENIALNAYARALSNGGAELKLVNACLTLAKIILIQLKDAPIKNIKSYRIATDVTLPLFNMPENKHLFLIVVREFYNFWSGDPDAASKVLKLV
jgi:hypothetical protein